MRRSGYDIDAAGAGALGQDARQIGAAQVHVLAAERAAHPLDRHGDGGGAVAVDEFQGIDRVADRAKLVDKAHALGHVPAGAEKSIM
jgi:hypothetical protein